MLGLSRRELLGAGIAALLPAWPARVVAALEYGLKATLAGPDTWVVYGKREYFTRANGGNIVNTAFVDTADGAVVIDTGSSRLYGEAMHALVRRTTGKDVVRTYVTHHHPDHFLGNQAFPAETLASTPGVIANISEEGDALAENLYRLLGDWMLGTEVVVPATALGEASEQFGRHKFQPIALSGHTSADLALLDETTGVLFAGDLVFLDRAPTTPHAELDAWRRSIGALGATAHSLLVPGHGPAENGGRALAQTLDYLDWLERTLTGAVGRGLTTTEAVALDIPERFDSLAVVNAEYRRSVIHLYEELEVQLLPLVGK